MKRHGGTAGACSSLLLAAHGAEGRAARPPLPARQPAPAGFDANRAAARLARILGDQRPHPVDSAAGDAVRERLIAEMRGVGLEPARHRRFRLQRPTRTAARHLRAGAQPRRDHRPAARGAGFAARLPL